MNVYMGYNKALGSNEVSVLVFADSSKEARVLAWPEMKKLCKTNWPEMAIRKLKNNLDYLRTDQRHETPHVVVDMKVCPTCGLWGEDGGEPVDGRCRYCR